MISLPGYDSEAPLGRGRTGEVFQARRHLDGGLFAVRRLAPQLASRTGVADSLRDLVGASASLRCPVAVPVVDVIAHEGEVYVIEPFVRGEPLSVVLGKGALDDKALTELAHELMDALADFHRQKVVHGDLRPANVLMTDHGPRLVGAGVALRTQRRTGQGGFLTRDPYDAPELDEGRSSHLTDIFALGSLLMYACTGEEGPHHFVAQTDGLRDVFFDAMDADPGKRPKNIEQLRSAFERGLTMRGRLRKREQTGPVITSWGSSTTLPKPEVKPQFAFPEEDDRATRDGMPAASSGFPMDSPRLKARELEAESEAARAVQAQTEGKMFAAAARPDAPMVPRSGADSDTEAEKSKWHVVDLTEDGQDRPLVDIDIEDKMVSARKPGTKPPGERVAELVDLAQSHRKWVLGVSGGLLALILLIALWPHRPDEMVLIKPDGAVPVGDPEGQRDEKPGATATVAPFLVDRTEVRVADYRACIDQRVCSPPAVPLAADESLPATGVNWIQAQVYCRSVDKRLPSENEWEAAARQLGRYPWGDEPPSCGRAIYGRLQGGPCAEEDVTAGVVPSVAPDDAPDDALLHLAGNVWELVDTDYEPRRGPGSGVVSVPGQSVLRVIKGGAFGSTPDLLRPGARIGVRSDYWAPDVGFRCAMDD